MPRRVVLRSLTAESVRNQVRRRQIPITTCTIYNGIAGRRRLARSHLH
jgi:hypothetical protein